MYGNSDWLYADILKVTPLWQSTLYLIKGRESGVTSNACIIHFSPKYVYGLGVYGPSDLGGKKEKRCFFFTYATNCLLAYS